MAQHPFVLVVEDDDQLRHIIMRNLQAAGYVVLEASSFRMAVDQLAIRPQLLILDINLPDEPGWSVASWLESSMAPVPTIVISGMKPDQRQIKRFEPQAFLAKPFDIRELLTLARRYAPVN